MGKKEEKTFQAVASALESLILEKDYAEITVSDIIEKAGVARSTFYQHFKKKDDVLFGLANHIFAHVFSPHLHKEEGHDFSSSPSFDYKHIVIHTFCHFDEDRALMKAIFDSSASHIFTASLRKQAMPLIEAVYALSPAYLPSVPKDIAISILLGSFIDLLKSFVVEQRKESAEEMAEYFFRLRFQN